MATSTTSAAQQGRPAHQAATAVPAGVDADRMSDAAVQARTGKTWPEWFAILDAAGGQEKDHKAIVAYLHAHHPEIGPWWEQSVTVTYEKARGLREKHQRPGGYAVSVNRTVNVPAALAFAAWADAAQRARWLPDPDVAVRKATPPKTLRVTWVDGRTSLDVRVDVKGEAKCQVSVQHDKLAGADEAAEMKAYWTAALARLKGLLEG